jgi:hypothetical protein
MAKTLRVSLVVTVPESVSVETVHDEIVSNLNSVNWDGGYCDVISSEVTVETETEDEAFDRGVRIGQRLAHGGKL